MRTTGSVQTFTAPVSGTYRIECWGARGGSEHNKGGHGAYVSGELHIEAGTSYSVYVGGAGRTVGDTQSGDVYSGGGWNGGGNTSGGPGWGSGAGGGATDLRTTASTYDRFIVAGAGGGGASWRRSQHPGGSGGVLIGGSSMGASGGTQAKAGHRGGFGYGGSTEIGSDSGAGGSGWYGGGAAPYNEPVGGDGDKSGAGGSSYVSGMNGCENSRTGIILTNTVGIPGNATMPLPDRTTNIGWYGDGYARVTILSLDNY